MEKLGGPAFIPNPLTSPALMVLASTAEAARSSSPSSSPLNEYHSIYSTPSSRYLDGEAVHRMVLSSASYQHRAPHLALYPGAEHYSERVPPDFNPHYLQIHHHLSSGLLHKANGPTAVFNGTGAFRRVTPPEHGFPFHHLQHQRSLLERERLLEGGQYKTSELETESSNERTLREKVSPRNKERADSADAEQHETFSPRITRSDTSGKFDNVNVKKEFEEESKYCDEDNRTSEDTEIGRISQSKSKSKFYFRVIIWKSPVWEVLSIYFLNLNSWHLNKMLQVDWLK